MSTAGSDENLINKIGTMTCQHGGQTEDFAANLKLHFMQIRED